ncbi:hypothetical protein K438DRAFT_1827143 [Mycena galopus ATCC 62051]|nr:hypothetical protein K438DRAFT_1827143 [Mycena galopus ATCC 62051]
MAKSTLREPVGTSWANATSVPWGSDEVILNADVAADMQPNTDTGDKIIVFVIPDDLA